ncbi:hypothetical protein [Anaeroselena agilis]|uniref:Uncharacterized protein n=1 Tax=Anaeroselena agilis TaxID=3063788 RepID=A0ABU3P195_9FIRM|nr:hypothetical protein [Selenomonadales bacterium 4137-cl]
MQATMSEIDRLVIEGLVPFRNRLTATFRDKHPYLFGMASAAMAGKESKFGVQVTEGGRVAGEYTLHVSGVEITHAEPGRLESGVQLPYVGTIKPYMVIERSSLERIIGDEAAIMADPFPAMLKHLPDMTVKFLR